MKKKITLGLIAVVAVAGGVAALSAYEAHVINVTAKIENALSVATDPVSFGTVFPQEKLYRDLTIQLSPSFIAEDDADDVNYVIKQKAKPKNPDNPDIPEPFETWHEYCAATLSDPTNCYYLLCPYLSKMPDGTPVDETGASNDTGLSSYHDPAEMAYGRLAKSESDTVDNWVIDLDVPCFDGQCAQDWTHQGWELPSIAEGQMFGCDLWIEVTGISRFSDL